ncbi:MAG: tyrosine--tRNA ligase [Chloroflexi bacterium]|nr:tyrosine--tRNA ligase [Chloroflexota bacterium]
MSDQHAPAPEARERAIPLSRSPLDPEFLLRRGVAEIIPEAELRAALESGLALRLKEGFDPSAPDIHLGHAVGLRKLRQFQRLGHKVVLIVGDWTAQIGDPSSRTATRRMLARDEVLANAETYMQQFFQLVDRERTEVAWQSGWFGKFGLADVIQLTSRFTVAQMLQREDFARRFAEQRPIAVTELLYPLLQAYDSVAIRADVEFGGMDQKFNILVGRELQQMADQRPQQVFLTRLLVGLDGVQKMSKSLGNYIGITEPAETMYGKVMRLSDAALMDYFELLTDVPDAELRALQRELEAGTLNAMDAKMRLAREIVAQFHSHQAALAAEETFVREHRQRLVPTEAPPFHLASPGPWEIVDLLVQAGLAPSRSEGKRLVTEGGVELDGHKITNPRERVTVQEGQILRRGRVHKVRIQLGGGGVQQG